MKVKKFFHNLFSRWYLLLIIGVVSIIISSFYCHLISMPRNEETISIFMSTYTQDLSKIREDIEKENEQYPYLREINIFNVRQDDTQFDYFFSLKGLNVADIFILPESFLDKQTESGKLKDELCNKQFAKLNQTYLNNFFNFTYDDSGCGIYLHKIGEENNKITYFENETKDDNYLMFFRKNSLHIGSLNDTQFETAFKIGKLLVNYGQK